MQKLSEEPKYCGWCGRELVDQHEDSSHRTIRYNHTTGERLKTKLCRGSTHEIWYEQDNGTWIDKIHE